MASFDVFDSFFIIKTSQKWGRTWYNPWKSKIEAKLHENPSYGELRSLFQINQAGKEENQRRNLTLKNFTTPYEIFASQKEIPQPFFHSCEIFASPSTPCETDEFRNPFSELRNFRNTISDLQNLPVIFRYFCIDSVRFLPQDILWNYLFSLCN